MTLDLRINSAHDPRHLQQAYAATGRLQVPNFLEADCATQLHRELLANRDWYLTYNEGAENFESEAARFQALSPAQQQRFMANLYARAREGFQYLFKQYYISGAIKRGEQPGHPLHPVEDFVNSEGFLSWMRELTDRPEIAFSDCYASRYEAGHFLTEHNDIHGDQRRIAAWVISMTPEWNPDWGGYLAFYDDAGNIEAGFKPSFNTLNIFSIPQKHAVQILAPFAGQPRTSLLGWLQH